MTIPNRGSRMSFCRTLLRNGEPRPRATTPPSHSMRGRSENPCWWTSTGMKETTAWRGATWALAKRLRSTGQSPWRAPTALTAKPTSTRAICSGGAARLSKADPVRGALYRNGAGAGTDREWQSPDHRTGQTRVVLPFPFWPDQGAGRLEYRLLRARHAIATPPEAGRTCPMGRQSRAGVPHRGRNVPSRHDRHLEHEDVLPRLHYRAGAEIPAGDRPGRDEIQRRFECDLPL